MWSLDSPVCSLRKHGSQVGVLWCLILRRVCPVRWLFSENWGTSSKRTYYVPGQKAPHFTLSEQSLATIPPCLNKSSVLQLLQWSLRIFALQIGKFPYPGSVYRIKAYIYTSTILLNFRCEARERVWNASSFFGKLSHTVYLTQRARTLMRLFSYPCNMFLSAQLLICLFHQSFCLKMHAFGISVF